ncbi:MAG: hypothetical protein ABI068_09880, partial [Ktedonobacterales bacterium]
ERYQRAVRACLPDPTVAFSACGDVESLGTPCATPDCLTFYASCHEGAENPEDSDDRREQLQFTSTTRENEEHHVQSDPYCACCCA